MSEELIIEQITLYTQQLDSFDQLSTNYVMTVISFIGVIIAAIMALMGVKKRLKDNKYMNILNRAISMAFLTIPSIITLFMYVFAVNCRKVALYRGYLQYLEDLLNSNAGSEKVMFHTKAIQEFYGISFDISSVDNFVGKQFWSMSLGPIVMVIFLFMIMIVSFKISKYFALQADGDYKLCKVERSKEDKKGHKVWIWSKWEKYKRHYYVIYKVLFLVSIVFCILCCYDCICNSGAMNSIHFFLNKRAGI